MICVNNSFYPVNAKLDLSATELPLSEEVEVKFENRKLSIDKANILKDEFKPFERHVYKLQLK